ncbi:MAG: 16S rRNA (guanine(966)-N(2))-methyltransferase RsmD [Oscillospiraceae bacterium]|nr:16S rRNA (guanine(966)-N(2))-methyltransferase RsmD [Oscillospiraceae bacterium]
MRIISGEARGKKLKPPGGQDIRPTADIVKEAMFSIIQFDIPGSVVLDLFSGSGQLGIEALSRGAKKCFFIDEHAEAVKLTKHNTQIAGFSESSVVLRRDFGGFLKTCDAVFDLAFIDPPYQKGLYEKALIPLSALMSKRGKALCEHGKELELPETCGGFEKIKAYSYGQTAVTVYGIKC